MQEASHDHDVGDWESTVGCLMPVFGRPGWAVFTSLLMGWIMCTGRRTVVGIYRQADPLRSRSHDAYHRFFRCGAWKPEVLWRTLALALVKSLAPRGVLHIDLDDTLLHRTGRKVAGAGLYRDAVRSFGKRVVIAWGINVLVVTLRVQPPWGGEPLGLPIWVKVHKKGGDKLTKLATEALSSIASWFPDRTIRCCADGAYAGTLLSSGIPRMTMISRIRRDASLYEQKPKPTGKRGRPRQRGAKIGSPTTIAQRAKSWKRITCDQRGKTVEKHIHQRVVLWYSVTRNQVLLVIVRDPTSKEPDDFFVCSDIDMPAAGIASAYAGRWSIEDTFRATKQSLHVQQPQSWTEEGPERAAVVGFLLYTLVWWWFLGQPKREQTVTPTPWYASKQRPSFTDALAAIRRRFWTKRIIEGSASPHMTHEMLEPMLDALSRAA